jgi:hypothetical protein
MNVNNKTKKQKQTSYKLETQSATMLHKAEVFNNNNGINASAKVQQVTSSSYMFA